MADRKKASFFEKAIVSVDLANLSTLNIIWKVFGIHLVLLPADFLGKNKLAHSKEHIGSGGRNWIKFLEPTMVMLGVIGPFALLPQVIKVYITHSEHAGGHSLISWGLFAILSLLWLSYGLYQKRPSIYVGNTVSLILNLLMMVGIIIQVGITY